MAAPVVPSVSTGNEQFSIDMRAFHSWEAGELWTAVEAFFNGRLISTTGTSVTSNTVGTGDKTFTTQSGLGYVTGMPVSVVNTANPANYMSGFVKSYSSTTLVVTVITTGGSGTLSAWSIALGLSGGGASLGVNTFIGTQTFAAGAAVASAATVNLTALTDGNFRTLTGTTNISAWTIANGALHKLVYTGAGLTLTHNATTNNVNGNGQNVPLATGDRLLVMAIGGIVYVEVVKNSTARNEIQPITASVAANALTITINPTSLDFRSSTLGSGAVNTRTVGTAISMTVSSGSTLGTVSAIQSRIAVLAIDNAGTIEVACVNLAGGTDLSETGLISTTAEGGAGAADSATVIYSTTARTSVPYRVVGYVESTQATAGTWATSPSTIQGAGGNAITAMSSLGYGQTWQNMTGSRATATTYYNTTGRPIEVLIAAVLTSSTLTVGTMTSPSFGSTTQTEVFSFTVPAGMNYSLTGLTSITWLELR